MSILQLEGAYENELAATGEFNPHAPKTAFLLPSGQRIVLPTELLVQAISGAVPFPDSEPSAIPETGSETAAPVVQRGSEDQVISLVAEQLLVGKTQVETGRVRIRRESEEVMQTVSVPLTDVRWEVEHVPVGQVIEAQPEVRKVGETLIFPLVEERLVVTRELWLREEVHVRRVMSTTEKSADFAVRRDVLVEDRNGSV